MRTFAPQQAQTPEATGTAPDESGGESTGRPVSEVVRRRFEMLVDTGSLTVVLDVAGMVGARGDVRGRAVTLLATDPAVSGGALSGRGCAAAAALVRTATAAGEPVVSVWHSGGARLDEGVESLNGVAELFAAQVKASGVVPQIAVALGACAGGAAYGPGLCDVFVMGPDALAFLTGPAVVHMATGEAYSAESLGGPAMHAERSGVAHLVCSSDEAALSAAAQLADLLRPAGRQSFDPVAEDAWFADCLPANPRRAYDMRPVVSRILDCGSAQDLPVELGAAWAPNLITTLGRLGGRPVGIVANNPLRLGGCLTAQAADKGARFVRMCDALGIPLVVLVDVPGFMPGLEEEAGAVIRRGAKLVHAFADCSVPRVTLVVRKAYGGAFIAMNARALGATRVLAWPNARLGVMAAESAVPILHKRRLHEMPAVERDLETARLAMELSELESVSRAVARGAVDEVIAPATTRAAVMDAIGSGILRGNIRNIPL